MKKYPLLPFISNDDLYSHTSKVLNKAHVAVIGAESRFYNNAVDPFSALFDAMRQELTLTEWLEQEKARQIQKSMQNELGVFHENIIGAMPGWERLSVGNVIDVCNMQNRMMAEIKNKHNTTKGSDKKSLYDNLQSRLGSPEYQGFTAYYVEIIPSKKMAYDQPFTPSDNIAHQRRSANQSIRIIDGHSFYAKASGHADALEMLYQVLPVVIGDILGSKSELITKDELFTTLFQRVFQYIVSPR